MLVPDCAMKRRKNRRIKKSNRELLRPEYDFSGGVRGVTAARYAEGATTVNEVWDRQFEGDVKAGKFDRLAERALRAHSSGKSTKL